MFSLTSISAMEGAYEASIAAASPTRGDRYDRCMPLPTPRTSDGAAGLQAIIDAPKSALIALDFDGTLAPIVDRPQDARAIPGAIPALAHLAEHVCRIAIVTGRPARKVVELGGFSGADGLGSLVVYGQYGRE